jgi:hypothetical protein
MSLDLGMVAAPAVEGHAYKVGQIFYNSWGYDQTNVDFYETVAVTKHFVHVKKVHSSVELSNAPQDMVVALPGQFVPNAPVLKKKVSKSGHVGFNSYSSLYPWDGKPKYETSSGWGH